MLMTLLIKVEKKHGKDHEERERNIEKLGTKMHE